MQAINTTKMQVAALMIREVGSIRANRPKPHHHSTLMLQDGALKHGFPPNKYVVSVIDSKKSVKVQLNPVFIRIPA